MNPLSTQTHSTPSSAIMAAAAATSCSSAISAASETLAKPSSRSFSATSLALQSSSSKLNFKSLKLNRCGALGARMVAAPVKAPVQLDFDTKVFKKEKINLAGHDEVVLGRFLPLPDSWILNFFCLLFIFIHFSTS